MKAIVCNRYGAPEVLKLEEIDKPVLKESEVLVKVVASSITTADSMIRRGTPWYGRLFIGLFRPKHKVTGTGFSGEIEDIGKDVKQFKKGDLVYGETTLGFGANAEYVAVSEEGVISKKPSNITFQEAAPACDGALTSLNFLQNLAQLQKGQKVLIIGASGSLGTAAIQIAKKMGATVTGVCSTTNADMVRTLGADKVIDYTKEDFMKQHRRYDVIYDTIGNSSFSSCKKVLTNNGQYLSPVLSGKLLLNVLQTSIYGKKKAKFSATGILPAEALRKMLADITDFFEEGSLKTVIEKHFTMSQIVAAHKHIDSGRKKGNIVLLVGEH